jgi:hypothetical protein
VFFSDSAAGLDDPYAGNAEVSFISEESVNRDMIRKQNRIQVTSKTWNEEGVANIVILMSLFHIQLNLSHEVAIVQSSRDGSWTYHVAFSLMRGRICNLLYNCFWVMPEQALLGRSPAELTAIFYWLI